MITRVLNRSNEVGARLARGRCRTRLVCRISEKPKTFSKLEQNRFLPYQEQFKKRGL